MANSQYGSGLAGATPSLDSMVVPVQAATVFAAQ